MCIRISVIAAILRGSSIAIVIAAIPAVYRIIAISTRSIARCRIALIRISIAIVCISLPGCHLLLYLLFPIFLFFIPLQHVKSLHDCKHDQCTQHRTATVAHKRQRHTRHRNKLDTASDRQKNLCRIGASKAHRHQTVKAVRKLHRDIHKHDKTAHADENQADAKDRAKLLRDGRKHEILFYERNRIR